MNAPLLAFVSGALAGAGVGLLVSGWRSTSGRGRPSGLLRVLARLGRGAAGRRPAPLDLERRIAAAGRPAGMGTREVLAVKLASAGAAGLTGGGLAVLAPGRLGIVVALAAPVSGFLAPDLWLASRAAERARAVRRTLPSMLDILRVSVEAGSPLAAGLREVSAKASGPLAQEWGAVAHQVELGVPLSQALREMEANLPQSEVRALCSALERARLHGAPLGRTLAGQARDARVSLRRRVQEDAAKAGPKIQLVVALLLVPSVLMMVAAALTAALLGSGGLPTD